MIQKKYLDCHAAICRNLASSNLPAAQQVETIAEVAWRDVDLSDIRKELKKNFPLHIMSYGFSCAASFLRRGRFAQPLE